MSSKLKVKKQQHTYRKVVRTKGSFFQKMRIVCQISKKDIPNQYPQLGI
jgi:hypothetical protein